MTPGTTLSHYKILEKIGEGGMGEVYRAEDTSLKREVAIKVLPDRFTKDPQRLARFEREAQLLASLNHPNIAAIYELEEADGVRFLSLELVEGETLAEKVAKGPLPIEEALEVCRQIAEGVEAAHEKGVIHRDLKPANVKMTPEGKNKVLDFGLAKAFEAETPAADISQSPTLTEEMTKAGVILGTAAYMSPEQAKGKPVDKRADIFAFGALLYELLTGKRAFEGETITETIAAVLKSEPDWQTLPETTPGIIRSLLHRCLQKDPHDRLHDIADARIEMKLALEEPATVAPTGVTGAAQPARWRQVITLSITAVLAFVTGGIAIWTLMPTSPPSPQLPKRFVITPPSTALLGSREGADLVISRDGRRIIYRGPNRDLYLRPLDGPMATLIRGTETMTGSSSIVLPDGESVAFADAGKLKKVSVSGGPSTTICEVTRVWGGSWGPGDRIVFASPEGLYRVSAAGGEPEMLMALDPEKGEEEYRQPEVLPGGEAVLFTIRVENSFQVAVLSLETGEKKIVVEGGREAHYAPTGHLVYEMAGTGTLMAVAFDLASQEIMGKPVAILEGIRQFPDAAVDYSFSDDGTLVYIPGGSAAKRTLVWVDRQGTERLVTKQERNFNVPRIAPDGKRLALDILEDNGERNVWIYNIARGTLAPLTFGQFNGAPVWTPDGKRLTFDSSRAGVINVFWMQADGTGEAEQLTANPQAQASNSWSPDGVFTYSQRKGKAGWDIWVLPLEGEWEPREFLATQFIETAPMFSPDGGWIAFMSNRSGQPEVYVTPYPGPGGMMQISTEGGTEPHWSPDGTELFYRNQDKMMAVSIQTEPTFDAGAPEVLFERAYALGNAIMFSNYDVDAEGRFLMIKETEQGAGQINVVLNWFEELKRLVPTD